MSRGGSTRLVAFGAVAVAAATLLGLADWPTAGSTIVFAGLALVAVAVPALTTPPGSGAGDGALASPALVVDVIALLLLGPDAAVLVAVTTAATQELAASAVVSRGRVLSVTTVAVLAMEAAGHAHRALGGTLGHFAWPWQAVPIAVAIASYVVVRDAATHLVHVLTRKRRISASWLRHTVADLPACLIAGAIAVGLAVVVEQGAWEILLPAAIPLSFAARLWRTRVAHAETEHRRDAVIESLDEGVCVVDEHGVVTLWNNALERITGCPRERAIGRSLAAAVPQLGTKALAKAIGYTFSDRQPRSVPHRRVAGGEARDLQVTVIAVSGGVALRWLDLTESRRAERELKRREERFALAAQGANDGLWEWDLRTQEFYVSKRWRDMLGLASDGEVTRADGWLGRVHPDDVEPLKAALDAHLAGTTDRFEHEHRLRHEDGSYRWFLWRGIAVRGAGHRPARIAGSLTDTTERTLANERLRTAGFVDPLTGLCNRTVFVERLGHRLEDCKQRRKCDQFAVLYLDLDRFKVVNDSLGHLAGDELLIAVSRRLESCLRAEDVLARLGGDEFAILLNGLQSEEQANVIAFRIQDALRAPLSIGSRTVFTSASIGIAFGVPQYASPVEIMRDADTAMYHAKARGKARHELFDADMHARARDRLGLENDLRHAVNSQDFEVYYQPIVALATGMCVGFESLVRWKRQGEPVSPATFVPIAEELGLIEPIGTLVLREACRTFADWQRRFPASGLDCITVNVSSHQLTQPNFLNVVEEAVHEAALQPSHLRLEITETALMDNPNVAAEMLRELRDYGVKIYLDDFGTGYSSLSHLHKLPVDALKIDRSFVNSLLLPDRSAIVESILALARTLNTSVVAEGIEEDMQARELARLGCTHAQGFLFSRPLTQSAAEALIAANRPLGPRSVDLADSVAGAALAELFATPQSWDFTDVSLPGAGARASSAIPAAKTARPWTRL